MASLCLRPAPFREPEVLALRWPPFCRGSDIVARRHVRFVATPASPGGHFDAVPEIEPPVKGGVLPNPAAFAGRPDSAIAAAPPRASIVNHAIGTLIAISSLALHGAEEAAPGLQECLMV
jgi:hypothetical protein